MCTKVRGRSVLAVLTVPILLGILGLPAAAHHKADTPRGCTIGFWKNHTDSWPASYNSGQSLVDVFNQSSLHGLGSATLLEALRFRGGPGLEGAARILLRQAVAALLNEAAFGNAYRGTLGISDLQAAVNAALASGSRSTMLSLADQLEEANDENCSFLPVDGGK